MREPSSLEAPSFLPLDPAAQSHACIAFGVHPALPWLALPDGQRAQMILDARVARIPNTQCWFRGMLSVRGNLLPVFDLAAWAGLQSEADSVLTVEDGPHALALLSLGAPRVLRAHAVRTPPAVATPLTTHLGAAFQADELLLRSFDPFAWLRASARSIALAAFV